MNRRLLLASLLALFLGSLGAGCGGAVVTDPLAPVPTRVRPEEIAVPALRPAWTYQALDEEDEGEVPAHAAALGDSAVFVPYSDRLVALDLDGELQWSTRLREAPAGAPLALLGGAALPTGSGWYWVDGTGVTTSFLARPTPPIDAISLRDAVVAIDEAGVYLLELTGASELTVRWQSDIATAARVVAGPGETRLFVTATDGSVTALRRLDGTQVWRNDQLEAAPLRAAAGERVYVVDRGGRLHAVASDTGEHRWSAKEVGMRVAAGAVVLEGIVWVPGMDAAVYGFTASGGSHLFRLKTNGRLLLDLAHWGSWIIASPQYGPWLLVHGPRQHSGPADPGTPRRENVSSSDDITLPAAAGPAGVVVIDASGRVRLLTPERGVEPGTTPER